MEIDKCPTCKSKKNKGIPDLVCSNGFHYNLHMSSETKNKQTKENNQAIKPCPSCGHTSPHEDRVCYCEIIDCNCDRTSVDNFYGLEKINENPEKYTGRIEAIDAYLAKWHNNQDPFSCGSIIRAWNDGYFTRKENHVDNNLLEENTHQDLRDLLIKKRNELINKNKFNNDIEKNIALWAFTLGVETILQTMKNHGK